MDDPAYLGADGTPLSYNLFAYCGNNPISGYDPAGYWDWGGVLLGLTIVAATVLTVATCGIATPAAAVVAASLLATGATMTYAAATETPMVMDLSVSVNIAGPAYIKGGCSFVIDFAADSVYGYGHFGGGFGYSTGISYSTGLIHNYEDPSDYSEDFYDINIGPYDHCWDPRVNHDSATQASSGVYSSGTSFGAGYDYYFNPTKIMKW